ncbi:MAG: hypothetical protein HKM93_01605 [Desulfobacteraceae bacterium]|nr:hypothetical protein [Desulfobacteraceae bacterium]
MKIQVPIRCINKIVLQCVLLLLLTVFVITGCGGGGGGTSTHPDGDAAGMWDEMNWDEMNWQ